MKTTIICCLQLNCTHCKTLEPGTGFPEVVLTGGCKNLDCGALELLLVQVEKENSIEFPFNCYILLIHILYLLLFIKSCASLLSHSLSHIHWFPNLNKKKKKRNINNNLAIWPCHDRGSAGEEGHWLLTISQGSQDHIW